MSTIRVLIADDHTLFRRGLRQFCQDEGHFQVVGEAHNGQRAVELAHQLRPDVILMDLKMPVMDGVQATWRIMEDMPNARIIILTVYREDDYMFEAIKAGACGYLLKDVEEETLIQAIQAVHRGESLIDPYVATKVIDEFRRLSQPDSQADEMEQLTPAEMSILQQVAQGEENATIAKQIGLSEKTISNRLTVIYQKLQVNNRTQAALYALRQGWVSLNGE
jgi:DNA-binding NarL/FixJ family response regulator